MRSSCGRAAAAGAVMSPAPGSPARRWPWAVVAGAVGATATEMRNLIGQVAMAAFQVVSGGTDAQVRHARQILADARKALYRVLAADDEDPETAGNPGDSASAPDNADHS